MIRCSVLSSWLPVEAWASFAAWLLISLGKYKHTIVSKGEASLRFDKTNNNGEDLLRVRHEINDNLRAKRGSTIRRRC